MAVGGDGPELRETIREPPQVPTGCSGPVGGELRRGVGVCRIDLERLELAPHGGRQEGAQALWLVR
jgi:hypothetical protein